jgi:microcystin-dependent protein
MDAYTGEIRAFGFNFPPQDWALCDGSLRNVMQYQALYSIIGNLYGGTSGQTFALPNLLGRAPMGSGTGPGLTPRTLATSTGAPAVALTTSQMPVHNHGLTANNATYPNMATGPGATTALSRVMVPNGSVVSVAENFSSTGALNTTLHPSAIGMQGNGEAHGNVQPIQVLNFCICLNGYYPVPPS